MFDIVAIITAITGGLTLLLTSLCWNMRRSRCINLDIKCLCFQCKMERAIMTLDEQHDDTLRNATMGNNEDDRDSPEEKNHQGNNRRHSVAF